MKRFARCTTTLGFFQIFDLITKWFFISNLRFERARSSPYLRAQQNHLGATPVLHTQLFSNLRFDSTTSTPFHSFTPCALHPGCIRCRGCAAVGYRAAKRCTLGFAPKVHNLISPKAQGAKVWGASHSSSQS